MEKRLIDANALLEHIKDVPTWCMYTGGWMPKKYPAGMYDPEDVVSSIENAPTVDAVEVVRCKDCKSMLREVTLSSGRCLCDRLSLWVFDNDFCSSGERRSE